MKFFDYQGALHPNFYKKMVFDEIEMERPVLPIWLPRDESVGYSEKYFNPPRELSWNLDRMIKEAVDRWQVELKRRNWCSECETNPCLWTQYGELMQQIVNMIAGFHPPPPISARRNYLFQQMTALIHVELGEGNHIPHSICVEEGIRRIYPDANYMGYMDR